MPTENETGMAYGNAIAPVVVTPEPIPVPPPALEAATIPEPFQIPSTPAQAEEIAPMSTAPVVLAIPTTSKFKSIMSHVLSFFQITLKEIIQYTPPAEALAEVLFPEFKGLEQIAKDKVVQVATLLQTSVLTIQQKYSDSVASDETNSQKLADVLAIAEAPALAILNPLGIKADSARITNAVNATVAILKTSPAPSA